jgi:hypothetical protein
MFQQDATAASPPSYEDPLETGRQLAAEIAAPLLVELEKLDGDDETPPDDEDA